MTKVINPKNDREQAMDVYQKCTKGFTDLRERVNSLHLRFKKKTVGNHFLWLYINFVNQSEKYYAKKLYGLLDQNDEVKCRKDFSWYRDSSVGKLTHIREVLDYADLVLSRAETEYEKRDRLLEKNREYMKNYREKNKKNGAENQQEPIKEKQLTTYTDTDQILCVDVQDR